MSTSQCVADPGLAESSPEGALKVASASRLLKGLLIGFAVTVTIGLGLTSWYVGSRIVAANTLPPPSLHLPLITPRNHRMQWFNRRFPVCISKWPVLDLCAT